MFRKHTARISCPQSIKSDSLKSSREDETTSCNEELNFDSIYQTISQLEHYLIEDHREDYKLRMALDRQTERVLDLQVCLRNERQRNKRLVDLILSVDKWPSEEEDEGEDNKIKTKFVNECCATISPLLMQQRHEDLISSYNICRKQLLNYDKELKIHKCELELLQSNYDKLLYEYKQSQNRLERIYQHYLRSKRIKNHKIEYLQEALNYATNCLLTAQQILESLTASSNQDFRLFRQDFQQNLQLYFNCLLLSEWRHCKCHLNSNKRT
ncbi:uncharacterized protein LOC111687537 isoform X1 [Lucilia cuprina]|uniref:uncharacterized protein LOC111687537 isoform X1 n=1 Tax=Lucilia cuprina TaxID=7375 RepID=UPI001F051948|nr:uncharacterized protein LOC111687537 isoform X1 [Lucilia cuprina]